MTPEALSLYWAGRIEVLRKVLSQPFSATVRSPSLLPAQTVSFEFLSLRHTSYPNHSQQKRWALQNPNNRGLVGPKLLTAALTKSTLFGSLGPVLSKAPDFTILVRISKRPIPMPETDQTAALFCGPKRLLAVGRHVFLRHSSVLPAQGLDFLSYQSVDRARDQKSVAIEAISQCPWLL